jgi:uncharacterized protein with NRDE domain
MCLAFVAVEMTDNFPLILMFNRDEDHGRKTAEAHWWDDQECIGGRDLHKGGTWAAVSRKGRFAMLTFIRGPREDIVPKFGRGELVPKWMDNTLSEDSFTSYLSPGSRLRSYKASPVESLFDFPGSPSLPGTTTAE